MESSPLHPISCFFCVPVTDTTFLFTFVISILCRQRVLVISDTYGATLKTVTICHKIWGAGSVATGGKEYKIEGMRPGCARDTGARPEPNAE